MGRYTQSSELPEEMRVKYDKNELGIFKRNSLVTHINHGNFKDLSMLELSAIGEGVNNGN